MWHSLTARLYDRTSRSGGALAEGLASVAHDRLTRMLPGEWSGQSRLDYALRPWCTWARGGLIRDETVIPKPWATALAGLAWGLSREEPRPGEGCSLVLRVWTKGTLRMPLGMRLWHNGGPRNMSWRSSS